MGNASNDTTIGVTSLGTVETELDVTFLSASVGGAAVNFAITYSSLGGTAYLLSKVGGNNDSKQIETELQKHKVNTTFLNRDRNANSTRIYNLFSGNNERLVLIRKGASYKLSIKDAGRFFERPPDISFAYIAPFKLDVSLYVAGECKRLGKHVVFNPGTAYYSDIEGFRSLCRLSDILILNRPEALKYTGLVRVDDAASQLIISGPQIVIITLDKEGCLCRSENGITKAKAFDVNITKPFGAGDSFSAGLLYTLIRTRSMDSAMRFANLLASKVIGSRKMWADERVCRDAVIAAGTDIA